MIFFLVVGRFGDHLSKGIGNEGISQNSRPGSPLAGLAFVADAIYHSDVDTIGDGVSALDRAPGIQLGDTELRFLARVPANTGGIER